jgi:phytoene dehydrogenase-like protein
MTVEADIVVAGAGHNSLITAAYLAMAGRRVVVVDARPVAGGGAVTEELLLPGYRIDTCSTGHTLMMANPVIADDELELISEFGLEYIDPDPAGHVRFPDGEGFTMWLDVDRTEAEFARFSARDAKAYRKLLTDWDEVRGAFSAATFNPVGGESLDQRLLRTPQGQIWLRRKALSAWDVVRHTFESRHVRAFVMWQAFQTLVSLDQPSSGAMAYSVIAGRQRRSWTMPRGGSGQLTDALVRRIETLGGTVVTGKRVTRLIVEDGRCAGFVTDDGEEYRGREAVVSTVHVKHLLDMAPADCWPDDFRYGVETFDPGIPAFALHLCTTEPPVFAGVGEPRSAVSAGVAAWPEDLVKLNRQIRDREPTAEAPWMMIATPTLADPSRAPPGRHTVKIVAACSAVAPGGHGWAAAKDAHAEMLLAGLRRAAPNMTPDTILAMLAKSPEDIEAANAHMIDGTFHGGDRGFAFTGPLRPAPGWAQHRMPIPGLYQTGGTTHPGGSITGAPGRNAAKVLLEDLGTSIEAVVAARRRRGVA